MRSQLLRALSYSSEDWLTLVLALPDVCASNISVGFKKNVARRLQTGAGNAGFQQAEPATSSAGFGPQYWALNQYPNANHHLNG